MALVIVATAGAANANSYSTLADADLYHESHLYADAWTEEIADRKNRALVMATRMLDTWFDWLGEVSDGDQALLWPRDGVYGPDGYLQANNTIPQRIKDATAEWARQLLAADRTADSKVESEGLKALTAGSVGLVFKDGVQAKPVPDAVLAAVSIYGRLRTRSGSGTTTLLRA